MELNLRPQTFTWVLVLIIVGIFQTITVAQVGPGSSANVQSTETPKRSGVAAAEPILPPCPPAGLPTLQSPPLTGHHKVTLSWNASVPSLNLASKAVGYCLYRSKKENVAKQSFTKPNAKCSDCEQINPIAFAGTGCVDHLVEDGTIYHYVVTAIDAQGNTSSSSNEAPAQIPPTKESADSVPAGSYPLCRVTNPQ